MDCIVSLPNSDLEAQDPSVTLFEGRDFKEVIKVKWDHIDGALIQQDLCPFKKRKSLSLYLDKGKAMWAQSKNVTIYQPGKGSLPETISNGTLILNF